MTTVGAGAKFDKGTYKVSAGLHGIGAKAVTALSEWTEAEVRRNGRVYVQEYERGKADHARSRTSAPPSGTGTTHHVQARPGDLPRRRPSTTTPWRAGCASWPSSTRAWRSSSPTSDRQGGDRSSTTAASPSSSQYLNRTEDVLHKPIYIEKTRGRRAASRWRCSTRPARRSGSAATPTTPTTPIGGTHLTGFRAALTRTLNAYGTKEEPVQERHAHRRGLPRGADGDRQRPGARAAVRVADEDAPEQPRGRGHRRQRRQRAPEQVPGGEPQGRPADHEEGGPGGRGARGGGQGQEGPQGPQEYPHRRRPAGQADRLHRAATATSPSCSWSRAIPPAARPRAAAIASSRPSCRCAARCSTSRRRAWRTC